MYFFIVNFTYTSPWYEEESQCGTEWKGHPAIQKEPLQEPFSNFPRTTWSFDTHLLHKCQKPAMAVLKVFCLCFSPRTGSVVLGGLGIIMAVLMIVPPCLILESHEYYFNEYIREQKTYGGN